MEGGAQKKDLLDNMQGSEKLEKVVIVTVYFENGKKKIKLGRRSRAVSTQGSREQKKHCTIRGKAFPIFSQRILPIFLGSSFFFSFLARNAKFLAKPRKTDS